MIVGISTHTPHAGCDHQQEHTECNHSISTHTPHVGCDVPEAYHEYKQYGFQLTHPMWGATASVVDLNGHTIISTHTPHVGCDYHIFLPCSDTLISTHTPHVGCDGFVLFREI